MSATSSVRPVNIMGDFLHAPTIIWGAIWAALFHYLPSLIWKNRQYTMRGLKMFYMFYFIVFSWVRSDSFFIMAIIFTRIHKKSLANACGKQSMKTFGTFPILVLATEFTRDESGSNLNYKPIVSPNGFDFISVLKQVIAKSKQ